MRYIASKLEPNDNYGRTSEQPRSTASDADKAAINAVKNTVFEVFRETYSNDFGINKFPPKAQKISDMATDMAIHRYRGAAMWTVVKAMADANIIDQPSKHYPSVTSAQAVNPAVFPKVGAAYFKDGMADAIATDLASADPQQLLLVEHYIGKWRRIYYQEQVRVEKALGDPAAAYHAASLDGWNKRIASMESAQARVAASVAETKPQSATVTARASRGGVEVAIAQARAAASLLSLDVQYVAPDFGLSSHPNLPAMFNGSVGIEFRRGIANYEVHPKQLTRDTNVAPQVPAGVRWEKITGNDAVTFTGADGKPISMAVTPKFSSCVAMAMQNSAKSGTGIPSSFVHSAGGNGLDDKRSATVVTDT
jgi:hypothetical protein